VVGAAFSGWFKLVAGAAESSVAGAGPSMVQVLLSLQWLVLVNQPSVVVAQAAESSVVVAAESSVAGAVAQAAEPSVVGNTYSTQYNHALHP
jgi:hypothetical protein